MLLQLHLPHMAQKIKPKTILHVCSSNSVCLTGDDPTHSAERRSTVLQDLLVVGDVLGRVELSAGFHGEGSATTPMG